MTILNRPKLLQSFAGDKFIENKLLTFKETFEIESAVETGTYLGATFRWLYNNFENVYSCEIDKECYQTACNSIFNDIQEKITYPSIIKNPPNMGELTIANIDSVIFLNQIGGELNDQTLFFLDAHWYAHCPLLNELSAIASSDLRPSVIAIHDFKTNHPEELGYDSYNSQDFTLEWIQKEVDKIYGNKWTYEYNNPKEAGGAKRGIIYITRT
jgi:hypothetical protein